jgi:hypothetical protein
MQGLKNMKKRVELTVTELQWIETALVKQMIDITRDMNNTEEGSQLRQILKLKFDNLESLAEKIHDKSF